MPQVEGVAFRPIKSHDGYAVGDDGSVWSCKETGRGKSHDEKHWRPMGQSKHTRSDYRVVTFYSHNKGSTQFVHRIVLEAFVGPRPLGMVVCHEDGNPVNNRLTNLRWGTRKENEADKERHGRRRHGEKHQNSKITEEDVREIRRAWANREMTQKKLGEKFGLTRTGVQSIVKGQTWRHVV